jgi:hypothetical protein
MKINHLIMMAVLFIGIHGRAQERKLLSLKDAIEIAIWPLQKWRLPN